MHEQTVIFCENAKEFDLSSAQRDALAIVKSTKSLQSKHTTSRTGENRFSQTLKMENERPMEPVVIEKEPADTEYLTVEFENLPEGTDDVALRKMYLKNMHVIESEQEINNINGKFSGKAKVKVRCQNGLRSDAFLKTLYKKGAKFRVKDQTRQGDAKVTCQNFNRSQKNVRSIQGASNKRNYWLGTTYQQEKKKTTSRVQPQIGLSYQSSQQ